MMYLLIAFVVGIALYIQFGPKLSNMQEGMWHITVEAKFPGADMSMPVKHFQCLTKEDPVPQVSIPGYECRLFRKRYPVTIMGNHIIWKVHCEGPEPEINANAHIRFKKDTFKGSLQMHTIEDDQKRFKGRISGVRTGGCH